MAVRAVDSRYPTVWRIGVINISGNNALSHVRGSAKGSENIPECPSGVGYVPEARWNILEIGKDLREYCG